jgi:hypothetical protein
VSFLSARRLLAGAVLATTPVLLSSCGNTYRATVGVSNPPPPPSQAEYLPVVISQVNGDQSQGLASILDASGDSLLVQAHVGNAPVSVTLGNGGSIGYVVNLAAEVNGFYQGSLSSFPVITALQDGSVNTSSLNSQTNVFAPFPLTPVPSPASLCDTGATPRPAVFVNANVIYIGQTGSDYVLPLASNATSTGVPGVLSQLQTSGIITNFTGLVTGQRAYAIETASNTVDVFDSVNLASNGSPVRTTTVSVPSPNYGLESPDGTRVFFMSCNGTVNVVDGQTSAVLMTIPLPAPTSGAPATAGAPIAADYVNLNNVLVTANSNGAGNPGTASIINASRISANFGSAVTVPVGNGPTGVAVLQDNSRAYVANTNDSVNQGMSSVSVVNLTSNTTNPTTIPLTYTYASTTYTCPVGGATQIVAMPGTTYQQVFVLCTLPNPGDGAYYVYAIRTYQDSTAPPGQSTAADVVSAAIAISGTPQQIRMTPTR